MLVLYEFNNFLSLKFFLVRVYEKYFSKIINEVGLDEGFTLRESDSDLQRLNLHVAESSLVDRIILFLDNSGICLNWINIFISEDLAIWLFVVNHIIWTCIPAHNYETDCLLIFPREKCKSAFVKFSFCIFHYWLRCVF